MTLRKPQVAHDGTLGARPAMPTTAFRSGFTGPLTICAIASSPFHFSTAVNALVIKSAIWESCAHVAHLYLRCAAHLEQPGHIYTMRPWQVSKGNAPAFLHNLDHGLVVLSND